MQLSMVYLSDGEGQNLFWRETWNCGRRKFFSKLFVKGVQLAIANGTVMNSIDVDLVGLETNKQTR